MNRVYLLIGGNVGDRLANLKAAISAIQSQCGNIVKMSSIYETAAWGLTNQAAFLNQALFLETILDAHSLLAKLLAIERDLGRIRTTPLGPRTIDIDIIYFNDNIVHTEDLTIPHPSMSERNFVLTPLVEIAPAFIHPFFFKTNEALLSACKDTSAVYKKIDI